MSEMRTFATDAREYCGGCGTGKSQQLVDDCARLVECGVDPGRILFIAATPDAARELGDRLSRRLGDGASALRVMCARELELAILATDDARGLTGRRARLLVPFELNVLMEDVKTSGTRPRRIKEMLRFFERCWTECADFEEGWLINDEERGLHSLVKSSISSTGGMLESEVSNLALRCVWGSDELRGRWACDYVLVDDYQLLNRASQMLANALASIGIIIACDPLADQEVFDPYPYAKGVEEFEVAYPGAVVRQLTTSHAALAPSRAVARLCADPSLCECEPPRTPADARPGEAAATVAATPAEERGLIAGHIRSALEAGIPAGDMFVLVPNTRLGRAIRRELVAAGVDCDAKVDASLLGGDVRDMRSCGVARAFCLLALVADPLDDVAWRSWCGFGDHLLHSTAFSAIRTYCEETGLALHEALRGLAVALSRRAATDGDASVCDERLEGLLGVMGMEDVARSYVSGRIMSDDLRGLSGDALLAAIDRAVAIDDDDEGRQGPAPSRVLLALAGAGDPSAAAMMGRILLRACLPRFEGAEDCVKVGVGEDLCGLRPRMLMACCMVQGLVPPRAALDPGISSVDRRAKLLARAMRRAYAALGKADERLYMSGFAECDEETAGVNDIPVRRIRLRNGGKVCTVEPSGLLGIAQG